MVSKYSKTVFEMLSFSKIKSTNEIKRALEKSSGKKINWFLVHKVLRDLEIKGDAEKLQTKWGIFWRRKK